MRCRTDSSAKPGTRKKPRSFQLRRCSSLSADIQVPGSQVRVIQRHLSTREAPMMAAAGTTLSVIQNCGHRPEVEKPEEFVRLVREFLADS